MESFLPGQLNFTIRQDLPAKKILVSKVILCYNFAQQTEGILIQGR